MTEAQKEAMDYANSLRESFYDLFEGLYPDLSSAFNTVGIYMALNSFKTNSTKRKQHFTTECTDLLSEISELSAQLGEQMLNESEIPTLLYDKRQFLVKHHTYLKSQADIKRPKFDELLGKIVEYNDFLGVETYHENLVFSDAYLQSLQNQLDNLTNVANERLAKRDELVQQINEYTKFLGNADGTSGDLDLPTKCSVEDIEFLTNKSAELKVKFDETKLKVHALVWKINFLSEMLDLPSTINWKSTCHGSVENLDQLSKEIEQRLAQKSERQDIFKARITKKLWNVYNELYYDHNLRLNVDAAQVDDEMLGKIQLEISKLEEIRFDPICMDVVSCLDKYKAVLDAENSLAEIRSDQTRFNKRGFMAILQQEKKYEAIISQKKPALMTSFKELLAKWQEKHNSTFSLSDGTDLQTIIEQYESSPQVQRARKRRVSSTNNSIPPRKVRSVKSDSSVRLSAGNPNPGFAYGSNPNPNSNPNSNRLRPVRRQVSANNNNPSNVQNPEGISVKTEPIRMTSPSFAAQNKRVQPVVSRENSNKVMNPPTRVVRRVRKVSPNQNVESKPSNVTSIGSVQGSAPGSVMGSATGTATGSATGTAAGNPAHAAKSTSSPTSAPTFAPKKVTPLTAPIRTPPPPVTSLPAPISASPFPLKQDKENLRQLPSKSTPLISPLNSEPPSNGVLVTSAKEKLANIENRKQTNYISHVQSERRPPAIPLQQRELLMKDPASVPFYRAQIERVNNADYSYFDEPTYSFDYDRDAF